MCKTKIRKFMLSLPLLVLICSLPAFGSSAQAEKMYQISESELSRLEQNSKKQEENSLNSQKTSERQEKLLKIANERIEKTQKENEATRNSLEKTQKYLEEYEHEAERKIQIKERQRDLWEVISAGLFAAVVIK